MAEMLAFSVRLLVVRCLAFAVVKAETMESVVWRAFVRSWWFRRAGGTGAAGVMFRLRFCWSAFGPSFVRAVSRSVSTD